MPIFLAIYKLKRLLTISLLLIYVNSNTEFHELLRLPLLVQHYFEHKQMAEDMSLTEFLALHYKTKTAHDDKDNSLPFKDPAHTYMSTSVSACAPITVVVEISSFEEVLHSSVYQQPVMASPLFEVFQPPRLA